MPKNAQTTAQLHSSHASKVMLKILQARLQYYVNCELPDVQAGFRKGRGPEIKLPISTGSSKKQESSRKTSISALLTMPKPLILWITINFGKFLKRWEYQSTWPASWETYMQVRKQQLELDMEQQFSSVAQSCPTLCEPMNCSTPGLPVHHQLSEFTQTHIHRVIDAIQPSHPLSSSSPPAPNPSQHQSLFQRVNSSHEVTKVLEFQL